MRRIDFLKEFSVFSGILGFVSFSGKMFSDGIPRNAKCILKFHIAGYIFYDGEKIEQRIKKGTVLTLRSEKDNPHDKNAVEILMNNYKLGYIPQYCNEVISNMLVNEVKLYSIAESISRDNPSWKRIEVGIYLN